MGNITSQKGNNYTENGQTPLNRFVEKVMNEDYFFTPNVSDDMIQNVDKSDINNNKVLLKRALCTGTTFVPISLPYVTCDENNPDVCESGIYTVKINATNEKGIKLPNIEKIQGQDYINAYAIANGNNEEKKNAIINKLIESNNDISVLDASEINAMDLFKYYQVSNGIEGLSEINPSNPQEILRYYTEPISDSSNQARIGSQNGCALFYRGTNEDIKYNETNDPTGISYNSFDPRFENTSNSKAFCGKVLQYNTIASKRNGNANIDKIGRLTRIDETREGNMFRIDEFSDCACLNSILAVEHETIKYINEEAKRLAFERNVDINLDTGPEVSGERLAQNNDRYCKNRLHDFSNKAPRAYSKSNEAKDTPLQICSSISLIQGIDQSGGEFDAGTDCGFSSEDTTKLMECIIDKNAPGCNKKLAEEGIETDSNDEDNKNKTFMIVIIVLVILAVIGVTFYFIKVKGNKTEINKPLFEPPATKIKYTKPSSDPLYRELN
jgi:hypothetical protein